jgi:hypothetical protein
MSASFDPIFERDPRSRVVISTTSARCSDSLIVAA